MGQVCCVFSISHAFTLLALRLLFLSPLPPPVPSAPYHLLTYYTSLLYLPSAATSPPPPAFTATFLLCLLSYLSTPNACPCLPLLPSSHHFFLSSCLPPPPPFLAAFGVLFLVFAEHAGQQQTQFPLPNFPSILFPTTYHNITTTHNLHDVTSRRRDPT